MANFECVKPAAAAEPSRTAKASTPATLEHSPPVPPEMYAMVRALALSGQMNVGRLHQLIEGDKAFRAWWDARVEAKP